MKENLQGELMKFLYHDVFNIFQPEEFLQIKAPGVWMWGDRQLTAQEIVSLKQGAQAFSQSFLYKVLMGELYYQSQRSLKKAISPSDLIAVRVMEYVNKVFKDKIQEMK